MVILDLPKRKYFICEKEGNAINPATITEFVTGYKTGSLPGKDLKL